MSVSPESGPAAPGSGPDPVAAAVDLFGPPDDPSRPVFVVRSPGRVNLIGDHIDYSGGLVLPMALDRGTTAVVIPRSGRRIRGFSANFRGAGVLAADLAETAFDARRQWFSYVLGVVDTALAEGLVLDSGFDMYLTGDIPEGGGLSSSASVELAAATALEHLFGLGLDPTQWALLCQRAENSYIGVACGIMDQLAIARGRAGHAVLMDCQTLSCDYVPMPTQSCAVLIASTNQPRQLAGSAYNDRRRAVEEAARIIAESRGTPVTKLVDVTPDEMAEYRARLEAAGVWRYAWHTATEQQRVIAGAAALRRGDLPEFGRLMRASHESLRDDFAVTGAHLDALAEAAWAAPGVLGARMTGAGFGGCTVNLVERARLVEAQEAISSAYLAATGVVADLFVVAPAEGARWVAGS